MEKETARERWKRESLAEPESPETVVINRPSSTEKGKRTDVLKGRACLHTVWRTLGSGYLVTVTLLNQEVAEEGRPDADECIFQAGICCTGDGSAISDYPRLGTLRYDSEEEELLLLYRERRVYAVGHGCASMWRGTGKDLIVSTTVMPLHETFPAGLQGLGRRTQVQVPFLWTHCPLRGESLPADEVIVDRPEGYTLSYGLRLGDYSFRLSYAQCSNACRWTGLHEKSPLAQFLLIWAMCRLMAFQRAICRSSSSGMRRPM